VSLTALQAKEAVIDSLGQLSFVVSPDQLETSVVALLSALLAALKGKDLDRHTVIRCACNVIENASHNCARGIDSFLEPLLVTMYNQVAIPESASMPTKVISESLRCVEVLSRVFTEQVAHHVVSC
jgi:hypothetical protein